MKELILYIITFVIVYLFYLFFVILRKKKLSKFKNSVYVTYLVNVSKLNIKKTNIKALAHVIALSNAFILSTTLVAVDLVDNIYLRFLIGFIILIPLQYLIYKLIGEIFKKTYKK